MLRAAAKNFARVTVLSSPADYEEFLWELRRHDGDTSLEFRRRMAAAAFARTAAYDADIAAWFAGPSVRRRRDGDPAALRRESAPGGAPERAGRRATWPAPSAPAACACGAARNCRTTTLSTSSPRSSWPPTFRRGPARSSSTPTRAASPWATRRRRRSSGRWRAIRTRRSAASTPSRLPRRRGGRRGCWRRGSCEIVAAPAFAADALETLRRRTNLRSADLGTGAVPRRHARCLAHLRPSAPRRRTRTKAFPNSRRPHPLPAAPRGRRQRRRPVARLARRQARQEQRDRAGRRDRAARRRRGPDEPRRRGAARPAQGAGARLRTTRRGGCAPTASSRSPTASTCWPTPG